MRKLTLLAWVLALLLGGCAPQETSCIQFKTGTFVYEAKNGEQFKIIRTENEQTELGPGGEFRDVYTVGWTGNCSYYCVIKETDNDSLMPFTPKDTVHFSMTKLLENGYHFSAQVGSQKFTGKLIQED